VSSILVGKMRGATATVQVTRAGKSYSMKPRKNYPEKIKTRQYFQGRDDQKAEDAALADASGFPEFAKLLREGPPKRKPRQVSKHTQVERSDEFAKRLGPRVMRMREGRASWVQIAQTLNAERVPTQLSKYNIDAQWSSGTIRSLHERYLRLNGNGVAA
jgi:hypothetical protein